MALTFQTRQRLREILRRAYLEKEELETEEVDREAVMRRIRKLGRCAANPPSFSDLFESYVWRLVPIVCLGILFLMVLPSFFPALNFLNENGPSGFLEGESEELRMERLFEA